jgi:D-sedoheptulose 7-phosphate isomerase
MTVIGVTGFDGGKLKALADVSVHIPVDDMGMTEALHGVVFHLAMCQLRERLAKAG